MRNKDFCIFILTHGRPNKVITYNTLKKYNCSYPIYLIIDNEDKAAEEYYANFGRDNVIMFDKLAISKTFDTADNFNNRQCIVYARNACFAIAKKLGYKYFLQLDDDYSAFEYRFDITNEYNKKQVKNIDAIFDITLAFYKSIPAKSISFMQAGDMLGGQHGGYSKNIRMFRKCMNTFFCSTDRHFQFIGRINEDVNTYTHVQSKGNLFLSFNNITMKQLDTQSSSGGMTETYLDSGTYIKSFYTVMFSPSSTKIALMKSNNPRLHHSIKWDYAVPKIVSETKRKAR